MDPLANTCKAILSGMLDDAETLDDLQAAVEHGDALLSADVIGDEDVRQTAAELLAKLERSADACEARQQAAERLQPWCDAAPNN